MPRKQPDSFTSIQIISSKAHSLWSKARERMQQRQTEPPRAVPPPPKEEKIELVKVEISVASVTKATIAIIGVIVATWTLFILRDKLIILGLAFFVSIVIDSSVAYLESWGIPRSVAVLLVYFVFLALTVFLIASMIPIVATQLQDIARFINQSADSFFRNPVISIPFLSDAMNARLSDGTKLLLESLNIQDRASALLQFGENLSGFAETSISLAVSIAGSVLNVIFNITLILVFAFFIQMEKEKLIDYGRILLPRRYRHYFDAKVDAIYHKMTQWMQGQIMLCIAIGLLVFIALKILGMPYALTLALLAGFTEAIPYVGPLIAAIPAVLIAFTQSGFIWAAIIAGVFYVVQTCENNLLVPLIMKHAVGLSPIAILFGMLVGVSFPETIHPVVGILLAVPATTIIAIFLGDFLELSRRK